MARGDSDGYNARLIEQNALREADGDALVALRFASEAAAYFYGRKSAGADREGVGPTKKAINWNPKSAPDPVLIPGER